MAPIPPEIEWVDPQQLRHIEGFSPKRVAWLREKIETEQVWTKPLALDAAHHLVLDGQHRMEVAQGLGLARVPVIKYVYADVDVWSLRPKNYTFTWEDVVERALAGDIYPYKTVKHAFSTPVPTIAVPLDELRRRPSG